MIIRVAIVEPDNDCLSGLVNSLNKSYRSRLEIHSCTSLDILQKQLEQGSRVDVILVDQEINLEGFTVPRETVVGRLVEDPEIDSVGEYSAVCKYVRNDKIYQILIGLYASQNAISLQSYAKTKRICFIPVSGGAGATVNALALCRNYAEMGKKVFYLNLESLNSIPYYLQDSGKNSLSDVIYMLHKEGESGGLKLESYVQRDEMSGIYFIGESQSVADIADIDEEVLEKLLVGVGAAGEYDYIVIDTNFDMKNLAFSCMKSSDDIIIVMKNEVYSKHKYDRFVNAIESWEMTNKLSLMQRTRVLINETSPQNDLCFDTDEMTLLGKQRKVPSALMGQVIELLAKETIWENL